MENTRTGEVKKIVVVEDDPTFLVFWERILSGIDGIEYELFRNSIEAKLFLEEVHCDLLISDVVMPTVNGYELARIACRKSRDCNVILTTAYGAALSHFDIGTQRFHLLHKPYTNISTLKRFIKHFVDLDTSIDDISEESSSENKDCPQVTEWKL